MKIKGFANITTAVVIFVFSATANIAFGQTVAIRSVAGEPNLYFTVGSDDCGSQVTLERKAGADENQVNTRQVFEIIDLNGGSLKYDDGIRIKKCGNYLRVNSKGGLDSVPPQNRGTPDSATVFIIRAPANSSKTGKVEFFVMEAEISNKRGFYINTGSTPLKAASDFLGNPKNVLKLIRNPQASANFKLVSDIWCQDNTDDGAAEDELYFIVGGKKSTGEIVRFRLPGDNHWSIECHNRGNNRLLRDIVLWQGPLAAGESIELTIITMEQDRGKVPPALEVALEAAKKTANDPAIGTALQIASFIISKFGNNRDDFIGAVAVRLTNSNGELEAEWAAKEHAQDKGFEGGKKKFHLTNDGEFHFRLWTVK